MQGYASGFTSPSRTRRTQWAQRETRDTDIRRLGVRIAGYFVRPRTQAPRSSDYWSDHRDPPVTYQRSTDDRIHRQHAIDNVALVVGKGPLGVLHADLVDPLRVRRDREG